MSSRIRPHKEIQSKISLFFSKNILSIYSCCRNRAHRQRQSLKVQIKMQWRKGFWVVIHQHPALCSHLVVEKHIDDGVDDSAELGQDRRNHASNGRNQSWPTEGGHQRHDTVGHPAQHVAGHHGQHHHQNVLLSALSCQKVYFTHLETWKRGREGTTEIKPVFTIILPYMDLTDTV